MSPEKSRIYFFVSLLLISGGLTLAIFWPFLKPLLLAIAFATVLQSMLRALQSRLGQRNRLSAAITMTSILTLILAPLSLLAYQLIQEAQSFYVFLTHSQSSSVFLTSIQSHLDRLHQNFSFFPSISGDVNDYLTQFLTWIIQHLGAAFGSMIHLGISIFIFLFALFSLLVHGPTIISKLIRLSPLSASENTLILNRLNLALTVAIRGNLLIASIQGCVAALGYWVTGVPHALLWGSLTAVAALIPSVGTSLIIIPSIAYLIISGHWVAGIGLAIWGLCAVGVIDNFLYPKLVGDQIQLHPLLVMLSVLGGISLFGPIGFILGPVIISLFFALLDIYLELNQSKI